MLGGGIEHYYKGNVFEGRGQTQHRVIHLQFTSSQFKMFTWIEWICLHSTQFELRKQFA